MKNYLNDWTTSSNFASNMRQRDVMYTILKVASSVTHKQNTYQETTVNIGYATITFLFVVSQFQFADTVELANT